MSTILTILVLFVQLPSANEFFEKSDYANAAAAFEKIPPAERTAPVSNRLGISYHLLNKLKEAETAYKDSIKRDPKYADAYNNLGVLSYSKKNFGDAEHQFRQALEADAEHNVAPQNLCATRYTRR